MRKLFYLGFCLLLMAGFGCAITDYGIITDNNQTTGKAAMKKGAGPNPVIDTQGKAHIKETSQVATIWPDGTDELLNFVDQKADGTAVLTTFNNFSTAAEPIFHDDLYCNTDRVGCSVFTAPDDNGPDIFDGTTNLNCSGARSLSILLATGRYYGECGNLQRGNKLSLNEKAELFNTAIFANRLGREGLLYKWNSSNLSVRLTTGTGESFMLPVRGAGDLWQSAQDNWATLDLRNSLLSSTMSWYADFLMNHATDTTIATITFNGLSADFTIAGDHPGVTGDRILAIKNRAY